MDNLRKNLEREEISCLQQMGANWIHAICAHDFDGIQTFCREDVESHLMTPSRVIRFENAADLVAIFRQWFGDCSGFQVQHSRVELVGERLGIFYRFLLREQGAWMVVEQQVYCTVEDGLVTQLHLLCSGFQPAVPAATEGAQLLEIRAGEPGGSSTCALLTPAIKARLREMEPGQMLEVRVDDPGARGDVEAWCRLSGNTLVGMEEVRGSGLRFFVKKK